MKKRTEEEEDVIFEKDKYFKRPNHIEEELSDDDTYLQEMGE